MQWVLYVCLAHAAFAVKVKVVMRSDEDSRIEDEESTMEPWVRKKLVETTMMPFLKTPNQKHSEQHIEQHIDEKTVDIEEKKRKYEEEEVKPYTSTEKPHGRYPNELIFPLIYRQHHINSMFKFGENWYTWSVEKRTDGSKAINYFVCYDEPKRCDDVGWERTDALPKCAFEIDSVLQEDRACINSFGVEPKIGSNCDGAELMKVSDIVRACGPRIRSLWRFLRVGRRPPTATKPADVNSLICEDEEECFISVEYRIHRDRITFSVHEPTRGQTFKSTLKRDVPEETTTEAHRHRAKKVQEDRKKIHLRKAKVDGKGVVKERNDSSYSNRRLVRNKIKIKEDVSEDFSE